MTDTSSLFTTYPLHNAYPVTALPTSVSPLPNGNLSPPNAVDEEEYTIKCICGYNDDDGNTVFCEKCDTWQHIECYYHGKKVPDVHFCTDCAPKDTFTDINADKARERQRRARELLEGGGDRRLKRPNSKAQKKKHRDTLTNNDQPNGHTNHERQDPLTNGRDQPPPAKKAKTTHRPSGSIASLNGESRKRAPSNVQSYPSPSKSPQELYRYPIIPQYTSAFLELYDQDEGDTNAKDNEHTIRGSLALSVCKAEPSLDASHPDNANNDKTRLTRTDSNWNNRSWPSVRIEEVRGKETEFDGRIPKWKLLRLQSDVQKDTIVGEIRGQIGTLDEYCQQLTGPNRWKDLSHPDPFVFFHPHMDVYIDSRRSGTQFRYIRRSCVPNVTMRSYITPDDEIHHCFVAKHDISAGAELTASWYLPPQFLVNDAARDEKEQLSFQERCDYISRVLANFGDCACGQTKCPLDGFDRRSSMKAPDPPKPAVGRKKKTKTKSVVSPLGTGLATNSRAGSETIKGQDEDDDRRSSSGSSRNEARSRDLTPQGGALLDEPPMLGAGLTQREIRKIQALEKAQKEQSQKGEKKQKKRPSGASNMNTPNTGTSKQLGTDFKSYSGSPPPSRALKDVSNRSTPSKPAPKQSRPTYVSTSVQTEPEQCEPEMPPPKRRKFCTPTQRLLKKLLHHRTQCAAASSSSGSEPTRQNEQLEDVEMKDATTSVSTSPKSAKSAKSSPTSPVFESLPQASLNAQAPLPSQAAHTYKIHGVFKAPAPRLNLSSLPPVPAFTSTVSTTPGSSASNTTPTIAQSPGPLGVISTNLSMAGAAVVTPSPAKKKLSLGDYMSRRKESATPSAEKLALNLSGSIEGEKERTGSESKSEPDVTRKSSDAAPPSETAIDVVRARATENEQVIEDIPMVDAADSVPAQTEATTEPNSTPNPISAEVQNVLSSLQQMQHRA
ncbi:SET domain-containing protein 3 [Knufia fluminis]|uniref:SET domain-containing protein 3 n=1 Tax=Knufia fluminis TaxID=191047 RepID=A0AAN8I9X7_9EURO|nr:SET domain-containing protein 3 [Knufia fluminis]